MKFTLFSKYILAATNPAQTMYNATLKLYMSVNGSTITGKFPPMLFIKNKNMAIHTDLTCGGTISTNTVNKIANQVSAMM